MRHALLAAIISALGVLCCFTQSASAVPAIAVAQGTEAPSAISCKLLNVKGAPIHPSNLVAAGDDLYLLDSQTMWCVPLALKRWHTGKPLFAFNVGPALPKVGTIPVQEFSTFVYAPQRQSIVVLDKSGDIFEYSLVKMAWSVMRPNQPFGSPDPEYLDMASTGKNVCLLDPERNQIWRFPATNQRYFREVLPWRLKPGDVSVADGAAIAYDGTTWVVRRSGAISKFAAPIDAGLARQLPFRWSPPKDFRPSRLFTTEHAPLYVVERENNRVVSIDKQSGAYKQFLFGSTSDLRGMMPASDGFWIVDGNHVVHRSLGSADPNNAKSKPKQLDERLSALTLPLKGSALPGHPGVWPGARRLYRHGVHKGTDFFHDPGHGTIVSMGTPVYAADAGKILRADASFHDMDANVYGRVIYECHHTHHSSEKNEDLLRGCQVWLDHGSGLITKYAHLDRIRPGLKPGMKIARGDLVGYVGVSGTGENLPGRGKHPHLHFEVWLDNKYVGSGLTPSETVGVYEDIFGTFRKAAR